MTSIALAPHAPRLPLARQVRFLRTAANDAGYAAVRIWTLVAVGEPRDRSPVQLDIAAMCRVVRVRMCLDASEQAAFDAVIADYPRIVLGLFVDRSDADALDAVRVFLATRARLASV